MVLDERKLCINCKHYEFYLDVCQIGQSSYFKRTVIDHTGTEQCLWDHKQELINSLFDLFSGNARDSFAKEIEMLEETGLLNDFLTNIPGCPLNMGYNCKYFEPDESLGFKLGKSLRKVFF